MQSIGLMIVTIQISNIFRPQKLYPTKKSTFNAQKFNRDLTRGKNSSMSSKVKTVKKWID